MLPKLSSQFCYTDSWLFCQSVPVWTWRRSADRTNTPKHWCVHEFLSAVVTRWVPNWKVAGSNLNGGRFFFVNYKYHRANLTLVKLFLKCVNRLGYREFIYRCWWPYYCLTFLNDIKNETNKRASPHSLPASVLVHTSQ